MRPAILFSILLFCLAGQQAGALDLDVRSSAANILDFSLLLEHSNIDLELNGEVIETNLERIGILAYDVPEHGVHLGLALGYAFSDFNTNSRFPSLDMDGYYLGVSARGILFDSPRWLIMVEGQYLYQSVQGHNSDNTTTATLSWNEYSVTAMVNLALGGGLRLFAAPVYSGIQSSYRERGTLDQTFKLSAARHGGFLGGLRYQLNNREFVSMQYTRAAAQGVVFRFRRLF